MGLLTLGYLKFFEFYQRIIYYKNDFSFALNDELDFIDFEPKEINDTKELLAYFDELLAKAEGALEKAEAIELDKSWSMRYGEEVLFTLNKKEVLRKFCMNHLIHHRAQLGIYLRILGVPVPAVYGPSADDFNVTLIEPFFG